MKTVDDLAADLCDLLSDGNRNRRADAARFVRMFYSEVRKDAERDQVAWLESEAERLDVEQRAEWKAAETHLPNTLERDRLLRSSSAKYELRNALRRAAEHLETKSNG